ncbi:aspartyl-phosphate phosphatase Spo0E family protein [Caldibacillus debilis]|uniref:Aspartyl-phosphate phosphatase Spo0E family protein n=1 Tax=Caldibacillus debilis TaxID=301148 RepID=A0A150M9Y4_9BACI|nr:aspartyl-phosphate phosphatase Spo0E family protein [Caldibacillus debilis]KYD21135.1 hypothetical protein B4135_1683 [Caldibacillus debilis]
MKNLDHSQLQKLKNEIQDRKAELIGIGLKYGLSHQETIQFSQRLDDLINVYVRETAHKKRNGSIRLRCDSKRLE